MTPVLAFDRPPRNGPMERHFTGLKNVLRSSDAAGATWPDRFETPKQRTNVRSSFLDIDKRNYQLESADDRNSTGIPFSRGCRGCDGWRRSRHFVGDVSVCAVRSALSGPGHSLCVVDRSKHA